MPTNQFTPQHVWYVRGEPGTAECLPTLFSTKLSAEMYARDLFPEEPAVRLYARVMSTPVHNIET